MTGISGQGGTPWLIWLFHLGQEVLPAAGEQASYQRWVSISLPSFCMENHVPAKPPWFLSSSYHTAAAPGVCQNHHDPQPAAGPGVLGGHEMSCQLVTVLSPRLQHGDGGVVAVPPGPQHHARCLPAAVSGSAGTRRLACRVRATHVPCACRTHACRWLTRAAQQPELGPGPHRASQGADGLLGKTQREQRRG